MTHDARCQTAEDPQCSESTDGAAFPRIRGSAPLDRTRRVTTPEPIIPAIAPRLSVIVPTLNEAENIEHLIRRLSRALRSIPHEIVVVDDASVDGTAAIAEATQARFPAVRVIRRAANFGLSRAILDGFAVARGDMLAVIDADLQHDPAVLPRLLEAAATNDIVVASRYAFQGATCRWSFFRELESRLAARWTRFLLALDTLDPLSGFFLVRREAFERVRPKLDGHGWKLLLEILAHCPGARVAEVPFVFRARQRGTTKMNGRVVLAWLRSLLALRTARRSHESAHLAPSTPIAGATS